MMVRLKQEQGTLLAVCTEDYAEMTQNAHSSYEELLFVDNYKIDVLP